MSEDTDEYYARAVEFVRARWDEGEAIARGADGELEPWTVSDAGNVTAYDKRLIASVWIQNARHIAHFDPAHVLADIAAKRAALDFVVDEYPYVAILFAQPFVDHPDFDPAWRV